MSKMQYATNSQSSIPVSLERFLSYVGKLDNPRVLELGTKQSVSGRSTMHKEWVPHALLHHGTDIESGVDVDIVADVHKLTEVVPPESYDVIISCSSFEHFKYPHKAAFELLKVLAVGGAIFVQTHFTFPLHAYPYDYFRFTTEALEGCFGKGNGFKAENSDYTYDCTISSTADGTHSSYLNSNIWGVKTKKTPAEYVYELDTTL